MTVLRNMASYGNGFHSNDQRHKPGQGAEMKARLYVVECKHCKDWKPTTTVHFDGRGIKRLLKVVRGQLPVLTFRDAIYERLEK